ncbi:WGR domain-containing protein [Rubellimicrobium arenae]|uniref:WGR domain-containing protein n=1 Tax=Rubellimicrobium arenae TaxID=2817372 RepID=UPI001FEF4DCA|nr:WGR domain-containing protein [Rubellimicrobium arenae]
MSEPEQLDLMDWLAALPPGPAPAAPEPALVVIDQSPDLVLLTRVDPSCNMRRFYSLALVTSLFGECGVVRHWGRIGTSGQTRTDWYGAAPEAKTALHALLRVKRRRGYVS